MVPLDGGVTPVNLSKMASNERGKFGRLDSFNESSKSGNSPGMRGTTAIKTAGSFKEVRPREITNG